MQTIGLVPGAMKPFHAGHNHLIQTAIEECDHILILTSTKDRGIINGNRMLDVWDKVILPLLPNKVEVVAVRSPVRGVYDYFEWNRKPERTYRIYGGTEDIARLSKARIPQYYPDLNVVNVAEENPEAYTREVVHAKGEWVRESIKAGDHGKFRSFLPDFLKPHTKEYLKTLLGHNVVL